MKKIFIYLIPILIIAFITYYTWPRKITHTFNGVIISQETKQVKYKGTITLEGYLNYHFFAGDSFDGKIVVDENVLIVKTAPPSGENVFIRNLKEKFNASPIVMYAENRNKKIHTTGIVYVTRDLKKMFGTNEDLKDAYKDESICIAAPANNFDEAKKIINSKFFYGY